MEKVLSELKCVYLIGIGGIGMSGLALLLKDKGIKVSGSDAKESYTTLALRKEGIEVFIGHKASNLSQDVQLISYSSAVNLENPEIVEAKKRGIPILKRGQLLWQIAAGKKTIAIAGSHGKTTVTSLTSHILTFLGRNPTAFVGGVPLNYLRSAWWGKDYFVIETDESDGSFLECYPWVSIITNIDDEHLDHYKNFDNLADSFMIFGRQTKAKVIGCGDDAKVAAIVNEFGGITYGFGKNNRVRGQNFHFDGNFSFLRPAFGGTSGRELRPKGRRGSTSFDLFIDEKYLLNAKMSLLGEHNVLNALAVFAFFFHLNEDLQKVAFGLKGFKGTKRRFQIKARIQDVTFVDDYGHHPTEIRMVLKAARLLKPKRLIAIFEPHRFSRVKFLIDEFSGCFNDADELVITDICSANERELKGINTEFILAKIGEKFLGPLSYVPKDKLPQTLALRFEAGDLVIGLGAGSINLEMEKIIEEFKRVAVKA